ncbi:MAG: SRPBCC domain-containing protein, partial [Pseudomonadota bacterium]
LKVNYHLVTPDRQITFTEELWDGEQILTVALITFDLKPIGEGETALTLTDQVTSFVGAGPVDGHREGYSQALTNLQQHLTSPKGEHSH